MKKFIFILMFAFALISCEEQKIQTMGQERYIYFQPIEGQEKEKQYEYNFSFIYEDDSVVEMELVFPISYAGRPYEAEMGYALTVDTANSTAVEGVDYQLPEKNVFAAGSYQDELKLKIIKTPILSEEKRVLVLNLDSNENFAAKMKGACRMKVTFTDKPTKPTWWDSDVTDFYLGEYSDKKFILFLDNIYKGDFSKLTAEKKTKYAKAFKKWLEEHPDQAVDGDTVITVPV